MAIVFVVGSYRGQPRSALAALAAAAIAMTAIQPAAAQDIGFQLSLAATAGLIVFAPWIRFAVEWLAARAGIAVPTAVVQTVALTLSATAATIPIVILWARSRTSWSNRSSCSPSG
jgi:competence protein ComEC